MSRCSICDYLEGHGSELHDLPNKWNKRVRWRPRHNEFQCDDCFKEIKDLTHTNQDYSQNDYLFDGPEQEDNRLQTRLSPLPIE